MKKSIFLFFAAILCAIGMNAATPEKLYLTPNSNWNQSNARFAAYFFGNGEKWVSMTKVAGETNLYEVTTPAGYPNVIFCRMNPSASANNWNNKWNQTGDLTIPTDGKNHFTVPSGSWDNATTTWSIWPVPAEKTYKDITFTITASSAPQIHYWEGGDKMVGSDWENLPTMSETAAGSGVYTYTVEDVDEFTGVKYLFKIGDLQTADQTTSVDVTANLKDFFPKVAVMGVNNWDGTDVMTVADDYLSASITLPLTAKKYDLKLTVDGVWKGHKDQNHITRDNNSSVFKDDNDNGSITADYAGDYVFTYTYANQTLTVTYPELPAVKTYKDIVITVVANVTPKIHYWDGGDKVVATEWETKPDMVATGAANTYSYTIKDVDEALGVKYIIVAGTAQTEDLHTTVDVTANFKDLLPAIEVMGINGWNAGEGIPMTIAEDYSASATINFTEAKTQEFKLTVGGAWKGHSENNKITRANNASVFTDNSGNASVKVDVAGDYVFTYTYSDKKLTVTYPASDEPIVPHYYIAGTENLTGYNWQVDGLEIVKEGDVYKHTFSEMSADIYEFKITDGTWTNQWGFSNLAANYVGVTQGVDGEGNPNGNIKIITEEAKNIIVIFDPANNKITLENWAEDAPATVTYVLMGVNDDWSTGIAMTLNEANTDFEEYMLLGQEISATDAVKVVKLVNGAQTLWCGDVKDGSAAYTLTDDYNKNIVLAEGTYDFYYDVPANKVYIGKQVPATATITLVDAGNLGATLTLSADEYVVGDEITASAAIYDDGFAFAYWKEGENIVSYSADYTFTVEGDRTLEAYFGMNMPEEMPNLVVNADAMTITGSNDMTGVATSLVLTNYDSDKEMWSVDASTSTISYGGNSLTVLYGEVWLDTEAFSMAMAKVVADFGGELCVFNLSMTAAVEAHNIVVENATLTDDLEATGFYFMEGTWSDGETTYPVKAEIPGFDASVAEATYMVTITIGGRGDDDPWLGFGEGEGTVTVNEDVVTLTASILNAMNGFAADVTISGTLPVAAPDYTHTPNNKYGTICLPYASASTTGAYFYEVVGKGTENGKPAVYLASVDALVAGVPYIFEATASTITVTYQGDPVAEAGTANGLVGTFVGTTVPDGDYILYNDAFCTNNDPSNPNKIKENRAYLDMDAVTGGAPVQMPGRRYIGMSVHGENGTTGLDNIMTTDAPVKAIENGQLIIIRNGEKYNVQGVRL